MDLNSSFAANQFPHPSEEMLESYVRNRLGGDQVDDLEIHLLTCETCQGTVSELDAYLASMKAVLSEKPSLHRAAGLGGWLGHFRLGHLRNSPAQPGTGKLGLVRLTMGELLRNWRAAPALYGLAASLAITAGLYLADPSVSPARVTVTALRGSQAAPGEAPANVPLDLIIVSTRIDERTGFHVEIVTDSGGEAWSGPLTRSPDGSPLVHVQKGLGAGFYWARLYGPNDQLLQEYGLRLR